MWIWLADSTITHHGRSSPWSGCRRRKTSESNSVIRSLTVLLPSLCEGPRWRSTRGRDCRTYVGCRVACRSECGVMRSDAPTNLCCAVPDRNVLLARCINDASPDGCGPRANPRQLVSRHSLVSCWTCGVCGYYLHSCPSATRLVHRFTVIRWCTWGMICICQGLCVVHLLS